MLIVGAGMAGCLAGVMHPNARIIESANDFVRNHDAVLRFREDAVSKQVGVPFRKVKVYKGVWYDGKFVKPNIQIANYYSQKVTHGNVLPRSIWNMEPSIRYVAPSDFHSILADMCGNRIEYSMPLHELNLREAKEARERIISTIPMNRLMDLLDYNHNFEFEHWPINVKRLKINNCDVHQTIYFPDSDFRLYRATLTGEDMIVESVKNLDYNALTDSEELAACFHAFGIDASLIGSMIESDQKYGKIKEIPDKERKRFMYWATVNHGIYSLGRYATWRNILMDDVLEDILKIRSMIAASEYDVVRSLM